MSTKKSGRVQVAVLLQCSGLQPLKSTKIEKITEDMPDQTYLSSRRYVF